MLIRCQSLIENSLRLDARRHCASSESHCLIAKSDNRALVHVQDRTASIERSTEGSFADRKLDDAMQVPVQCNPGLHPNIPTQRQQLSLHVRDQQRLLFHYPSFLRCDRTGLP